MPRLLPRLVKQTPSKHVALAQNGSRRKQKSLYRPIPDVLPSFHPGGRARSILLEENPVTDKRIFARHKRLPPRVRLGPGPAVHEEHDVPREMTAQEREWWSSPYLRMLGAPLRQCTISKRYLPNDFLVRLAVLRLPTTQNVPSKQVLVPDGLEHPRYKRRKARVSVYVSCWKDAVASMKSPVAVPHHSSNILFSKHLSAHIGYLLRLRILQELQVLIGSLKRNRAHIEFDADPTILRRLTRLEFKTFCETGIIPCPNAVAVLVVPPVNRDPRTKLRPRPSQEPDIPSVKPTQQKPLPPLSTLHYVNDLEDGSKEISAWLPHACIPRYNGLAMFPFPPHRAAFHKLLTVLLDVERHFRGSRPSLEAKGATRAKGDAKGSHAFLFMSNEQTVKRADTAALAIALWRLRMWEGDAVADNGWEIGKEWRMEGI